MTRTIFSFISSLQILFGCATDPASPPPASEDSILVKPIQLTTGFDRAGEAYFSPDMKWLIFQAVPPGESQYQMYLARLQYKDDQITGLTGEPIRISPSSSRNTCGFFSPDGRDIIFASTAGKEDPNEANAGYRRKDHDYRWAFPKGMEIFIAESWESAVAGAQPGKGVDLAKRAITNNDAYDAECTFSPDGKWIVFASNREHELAPRLASATPATRPTTAEVTMDLELFAMRADGSSVVRLTHAPGYDGGPFFSPDGKRIVYRSDRMENNLLQVYVADVAFDASGNITGTQNEKQLTDDANVNWGPFWHPDGKHIIYATSTHGHANYELYMMRADGSHKTRITFAQGADVLPVFSPDGKYLVWASKRNGKTTQVWIAKFVMPPDA